MTSTDERDRIIDSRDERERGLEAALLYRLYRLRLLDDILDKLGVELPV